MVFSVHVNALASRPDVSGFECYIWPGYTKTGRGDYVEGDGNKTARIASKIFLDALPDDIERKRVIVARRDMDGDGVDDRWINNPRAILQAHAPPVVLVECGYATNAKDAARLKTKEGRQAIAQALTATAESWFS